MLSIRFQSGRGCKSIPMDSFIRERVSPYARSLEGIQNTRDKFGKALLALYQAKLDKGVIAGGYV